MSNAVFKPVNKDNYKEISDLFNYYIVNSTAIAFYKELREQEIIEYFQIENPSTFSYCINIGNIFCGFCLLKQYSLKEGYKFTHEITIYLKQNYMGKGIGNSAINFLEEIAKKKGIKTIVAGICSENIGSILLFEKNKYVKCGHFKNMVYKFNKVLDNIYYQKFL